MTAIPLSVHEGGCLCGAVRYRVHGKPALTAEFRPGVRAVAAGTLDERECFPIDRHVWVQSKLPWVQIPDGMPAYQQAYVAP